MSYLIIKLFEVIINCQCLCLTFRDSDFIVMGWDLAIRIKKKKSPGVDAIRIETVRHTSM